MELLAWLTAAIAVGFLGVIVWSVAKRGGVSELRPPHEGAGAVRAAQRQARARERLRRQLVIVGLATVMALPFGILVAIYVNEFASAAIRRASDLTLDVLDGVPAIVIGHLRLRPARRSPRAERHTPARSRSPCIMLPLVARSTIEVLALVPNSLREARSALGAPRWRTTLGVVLPQTIGGILTGATLAVARVAGETAPLLLGSSIVGNGDAGNPPTRWRACRLRSSSFPNPRSGRPCAGLGGGARADAVHPLREPRQRAGSRLVVGASSDKPEDEPEKEEPCPSTIEHAVRVETKRQPMPPRERLEQVFDIQELTAIYGSKPALKNVSMEVYKNLVTAVIGPSGCGKSTFIRCLNRMNDLVPSFSQTGTIRFRGQDIAGKDVDPVAVRRRSAWSSSVRTRSRSRSTTTSPGA